MSLAQVPYDVMEETQFLPVPEVSITVEQLTEAARAEVLCLLAENPMHTVCMAGLIRDNGLESEHNRGTFWGCRNSEGRLEGVAFIGHHTLVEARTRRAAREFALVAQCSTRTHMIMGELEQVEEFWNAYADEGQRMRLACRELLFELRSPIGAADVYDERLRPAQPEDLGLIVPVQARLVELESKINPLDTDPEGFRARCLRRIERGRTWVVTEGGKLLFKAEVQADTENVIYLEASMSPPQCATQARAENTCPGCVGGCSCGHALSVCSSTRRMSGRNASIAPAASGSAAFTTPSSFNAGRPPEEAHKRLFL